MGGSSRRWHVLGGVVLVSAIVVGTNYLSDDGLRKVALVTAAAAFLSCSTFVVRYHLSTRGVWFRSAIGRNVMMLMACLAAAMGYVLSVYVFEAYPFRRTIGIALYCLIAYAAIVRTSLQSHAQARMRAPTPDSERRRRSTDHDGSL